MVTNVGTHWARELAEEVLVLVPVITSEAIRSVV